jgi:hypothetical protein
VNDAKERLTAMNQPIPEPNPVALARAQQAQPLEKRGLIGTIFSPFSRRPPVPVAATAADEDGSSNDNDNKDDGTFSIDPKVVQPKK